MEIFLFLTAAPFFITALVGSYPGSPKARRRTLKSCFFLTIFFSVALFIYSCCLVGWESFGDMPGLTIVMGALATLPISVRLLPFAGCGAAVPRPPKVPA